MKRPSFIQGAIVAAVLGFLASAVIATLTPIVGMSAVVRLVIPALGLAYILYLLGRSEERTGRVVTLTLWTALTIATWWMAPALPFYLLLHVGAIWLIRSLYFYSSILPALLDFGVSALSVSAAVWAIVNSGSVFLTTWCFFLVQALFVAIPTTIKRRQSAQPNTTANNERFTLAKRNADRALRQLFTQ